MRWFIAALLFLFSLNTKAAHINIKLPDGSQLDTDKIVIINDEINRPAYYSYLEQAVNTFKIPGPRVIIINSPGGEVDSGRLIIDRIEEEKRTGVKMVCIGVDEVSSMAFNIMSHCDIRMAKKTTKFLVHKIRTYMQGVMTIERLRELADRLEKEDKEFSDLNAKLMHLSPKQYNKFAVAETYWSGTTLLKQKYLDALIDINFDEVSSPFPSH